MVFYPLIGSNRHSYDSYDSSSKNDKIIIILYYCFIILPSIYLFGYSIYYYCSPKEQLRCKISNKSNVYRYIQQHFGEARIKYLKYEHLLNSYKDSYRERLNYKENIYATTRDISEMKKRLKNIKRKYKTLRNKLNVSKTELESLYEEQSKLYNIHEI